MVRSIFVKKYLYLSYHREPPSRISSPSCPSTSPISTSGSMSVETWLVSHRNVFKTPSPPLHRCHSSDKITKTTSTRSSMSAETWLKYHKNLFKTPSPPLITKILLQIFFSVWFAPKHRLALCRFGKRMTWMRMMRRVEKTSGSRQI